MRYCFLDTETTGLDSDRHDVWEIGLITREADDPATDVEYRWLVLPDLTTADPNGLRVGRYYERVPVTPPAPVEFGEAPEAVNVAGRWAMTAGQTPVWSDPDAVAFQLARLLDSAVIFGAVPEFDARFLTRWLRKHGQAFTANYHLVDIEAVAAGYLLGSADTVAAHEQGGPYAMTTRRDAAPPWRSVDLYERVGYQPEPGSEHTALGDARAVRDMWDLLNGRRP